MKSRPILFSAQMVRAVLDGKKSQTRRVIRADIADRLGLGHVAYAGRMAPQVVAAPIKFPGEMCPYGVPGDLLWVKEAFQVIHVSIDPETGHGDDVEAAPKIPTDNRGGWWSRVWRATDPQADDHQDDRGFSWRPAIHMPRWSSRITLEITDVSVQRLQEISEDDARAEGVTPYTPPHGHISPDQRVPGPGFDDCRLGDQPHRLPFADLWDSINGKAQPMLNDDGEPVLDDNDKPLMHAPRSWASNPYVWAIAFKRES